MTVSSLLGAAYSVTAPASRTARFRALLDDPGLDFLMEAHDGLSAKIVEETGFKGIWASGLSIATALGVRDRNEASWTQVIEVLEFMADATRIPILLDGDTGYGDFNNFRRLVKKLGQRGVAAVCIEDKQFPKTNSLTDGRQVLADVEEFCGKIKAGKDSQEDPDFAIIARVEALIAGWSLDEALKRAEAYRAAGADGILIHSKRNDAQEILAFAHEWAGRAPLVIVPTTYHATPTQRFREAGISLVIWANHNLRAAISGMREVSRRIHEDQSLAAVEDRVASLKEVFALAGNSELDEAERKYLGAPPREARAVVLAATRGRAFADLTRDKPKCMLDLRGEPLLRRLVRSLNEAGVREVTVVCGYKHEAVDLPGIRKVINDDYTTSGEVVSLDTALAGAEAPLVVSYGDVLPREEVLERLMRVEADLGLVVDTRWRDRYRDARADALDLVTCDRPYRDDLFLDPRPVELVGFAGSQAGAEVHGEWVGIVKLSAAGLAAMRAEIQAMIADGSYRTAGMPDLIGRLAAKGVKTEVIYVSGAWLHVNDAFDLAWARNVL